MVLSFTAGVLHVLEGGHIYVGWSVSDSHFFFRFLCLAIFCQSVSQSLIFSDSDVQANQYSHSAVLKSTLSGERVKYIDIGENQVIV